MSWAWVIGSCGIAYLTKLSGYLLPQRWLDRPWVLRLSHTVTIGLLASLVVVNTVVSGRALSVDARLAAVVAGGIALALRAPYLVVVVVGALAAAGVRALGVLP